MNAIDLINEEVLKIENIATDPNVNITNRTLSMWLVSLYKKNMDLPSIKTLSKELFISESSISKFIKHYELQPYQVLKYLFNLNTNCQEEQEVSIGTKISGATKRIEKAKRILLVGQGNSGLIAKMFGTKLTLKGYNSIFLDGLPDQLQMTKGMTEDDLVICFSFSMAHTWSKNMIAHHNAPLIVFTSSPVVETATTIVFKPESLKLRHNVETSKEIAFVIDMIDKISDQLPQV